MPKLGYTFYKFYKLKRTFLWLVMDSHNEKLSGNIFFSSQHFSKILISVGLSWKGYANFYFY